MNLPYTHADHASRCAVAAFKGEALGLRSTYVQARVGQTVCCARIVTAWDTPDGLEMWQLDLLGPLRGRMSTPAHRVRACSTVDGMCTCTPVDPVPDARAGAGDSAGMRSVHAGAAASALPDGNHGEYFSEITS